MKKKTFLQKEVSVQWLSNKLIKFAYLCIPKRKRFCSRELLCQPITVQGVCVLKLFIDGTAIKPV